jgi:hypothetical protein
LPHPSSHPRPIWSSLNIFHLFRVSKNNLVEEKVVEGVGFCGGLMSLVDSFVILTFFGLCFFGLWCNFVENFWDGSEQDI